MLDEIRTTLSQLGYYTYEAGVNLMVANKSVETSLNVLISFEDIYCAISILTETKEIRVITRFGNVPDEIIFSSESEVISFVTTEFPI